MDSIIQQRSFTPWNPARHQVWVSSGRYYQQIHIPQIPMSRSTSWNHDVHGIPGDSLAPLCDVAAAAIKHMTHSHPKWVRSVSLTGHQIEGAPLSLECITPLYASPELARGALACAQEAVAPTRRVLEGLAHFPAQHFSLTLDPPHLPHPRTP